MAQGAEGLGLVHGEYEAAKTLYAVAPDFLPRPIGAGTYKSSPDTHFCLSEYVDMIEEIPDMQKFCASLAKMHRDSVPHSSKGQFGFHVVTYNGNKPRDVTWCDTWEEMFSNSMKKRVQQESDAQGPSPELEKLLPALFNKVIPRLLRPLHAGENKIKPVLVHGDIWYGNLATNASTDEPIVFDPATIWAHNECEYTTTSIFEIFTEFKCSGCGKYDYPTIQTGASMDARIPQALSYLCTSRRLRGPASSIYYVSIAGN